MSVSGRERQIDPYIRFKNGRWETVTGHRKRVPERTKDILQLFDELLTGRSRRQAKLEAPVSSTRRMSHVASKAGTTAAGVGGVGLIASGVGLIALPVAVAGAGAAAAVAGYRASAAGSQEIDHYQDIRAGRREKAQRFLGILGAGAAEYRRDRKAHKQALRESSQKPEIAAWRQKLDQKFRRGARQWWYNNMPVTSLNRRAQKWEGRAARLQKDAEDRALEAQDLMFEQDRLEDEHDEIARELRRCGDQPDLQLQARMEEHADAVLAWAEDADGYALRQAKLEHDQEELAEEGQLLAQAGAEKVAKPAKALSFGQRLRSADQELLMGVHRVLHGNRGGVVDQARKTLRTEQPRSGELPDKVGGSITNAFDTIWDTLFDGWPRWSPRG